MSPSVKSCTVTEGWTVYIVCSIHKQPKKVTNLSDKLDNKSQWKSVKINNIPEWVHRRYDYSNFDPVYMYLQYNLMFLSKRMFITLQKNRRLNSTLLSL